jgi:hypothetical protein
VGSLGLQFRRRRKNLVGVTPNQLVLLTLEEREHRPILLQLFAQRFNQMVQLLVHAFVSVFAIPVPEEWGDLAEILPGELLAENICQPNLLGPTDTIGKLLIDPIRMNAVHLRIKIELGVHQRFAGLRNELSQQIGFKLPGHLRDFVPI